MSLSDVVIPTKSNPNVDLLVASLVGAEGVGTVVVVADGDDAFQRLEKLPALVLHVPLGSGIHVMWNLGKQHAGSGHLLFLNDDVVVNEGTVAGLVTALDEHPELGLVCPDYASPHTQFTGPYKAVHDLCYSRYNGHGGMGGFAMMLAADLVPEWSFDERMKWWYGDNDLLKWVTKTKKRTAAICSGSTCSNNESWTIHNDPPADFGNAVHQDMLIFESKWGKA